MILRSKNWHNILIRNAHVYWRFAVQKTKRVERDTTAQFQIYKFHGLVSQHVGCLSLKYFTRG